MSTSPPGPSRATDTESQYVEATICKNTDIGENEMKEFPLGDAGNILLIRQNGITSAVGAKCPHRGTPLGAGVLGHGRVRCRNHGACFNITTGDIEDFPGLDSLPCFQVTVTENEVKVRAKRTDLEASKVVKIKPKIDTTSKVHFIVIGGGASAAVCVETLRNQGFPGKITMISKEKSLPYERSLLSSSSGYTLKRVQFRSDRFYREQGIDVLKGVEASSVNCTNRIIKLSNGTKLEYDKLYIATGLKAKQPEIPGSYLENVLTLRTYEDAQMRDQILDNKDSKVIILGSGFIALETAAFCVNIKKNTNVRIVMRGSIPFQSILGDKIGNILKTKLKQNGVTFINNSAIRKFIDTDDDGKINQVEIQDGRLLPADIVIICIGGKPYTDFLRRSGIKIRDDSTIEVDEYLRTNIPDVFVGGDIAYAPISSDIDNYQKDTVAHFSVAQKHGHIAALNMLGNKVKLKVIPFYWSSFADLGVLKFCGGGRFNKILYVGDVHNLKFVAYYLKGEEVVSVSSIGEDRIVALFAEILAQGKKLMRKDVANDKKFHWAAGFLD